MTDNLKPCPFCGGEARAFPCVFDDDAFVRCNDCGCIKDRYRTEQEAVKAWNTRAYPVPKEFLTQEEINALLSGLSNSDEGGKYKLIAYEDAEEQGRLIALPNIPDECVMYLIYNGKIKPLEFRGIYRYSAVSGYLSGHLYKNGFNWTFTPDDLGKTVFLTREEAEAALAEQNEEGKC